MKPMGLGLSLLYFGIPALALAAGFYLLHFISNGVGLVPILLGVVEK